MKDCIRQILKKLGVIHRGFQLTNKLNIEITQNGKYLLNYKTNFLITTLICDPSHIAGRRDIIQDLCQTALDLNFDGLMVETHVDPNNAWSDAKQQIKPSVLIKMMKNLKIRELSGRDAKFKNKLSTYRAQIDVLDANILDNLSKRMKIVNKIGTIKKNHNVSVLQSKGE